ncbi:MAG: zinc-binding dehydrogenase [Planctomycetes bacterium]|nr:zinc-binding dehydrogenase [Planctomycetota bacterium]
MKKVLQNVRDGKLSIANIPAPLVQPGQVLIRNEASLISAGTEKMVVDLAAKSLIGKALERPDRVRQVLQRIRTQGLRATWEQVSGKLSEPIPLGYSSAGVVVACGAGVQHLKPGDRVASNGHHAEWVAVPVHLVASIPDNVPTEQAAFTVVASIAMQGVRLARMGLGETALVIGLGLIGQIAVRLLTLQGVRVIGTDLDRGKCELAVKMGAIAAEPNLTADAVLARTRAIGADAVLITAATKSDGPVNLAAESVRSKGRVVAVGAVGLNLPRQPFYLKEAEFVVSCSYGPGRYDPSYEQRGQDYPIGHVRWTEQRNMQAVLDLMGTGQLDLAPLISHRYTIDEADQAYDLIRAGAAPYLGIVLGYPTGAAAEPPVRNWRPAPTGERIRVGCLGAGGFARGVLLPALGRISAFAPHAICSGSGMTASATGERLGFPNVAADESSVIGDPEVDAVFVLTRHHQHAAQVIGSLRSGKHVFVEKPLAITLDEIASIEATLRDIPDRRPALMVGFNRRFAPAARAVRAWFGADTAPRTISIRFNAGSLGPEHWTQDEAIGGGRIIGEACHAIDLATYLAGSPVVRVFAESVGGPGAPRVTDDQSFITLRHANGSVSSVAYLAGGDRAFPKERIEVIGGGKVSVIDDFASARAWSSGRPLTLWKGTRDKGHQGELEAFADGLTRGESPIPWEEIRAVSIASILAVRSLREGLPFEVPTSLSLEWEPAAVEAA